MRLLQELSKSSSRSSTSGCPADDQGRGSSLINAAFSLPSSAQALEEIDFSISSDTDAEQPSCVRAKVPWAPDGSLNLLPSNVAIRATPTSNTDLESKIEEENAVNSISNSFHASLVGMVPTPVMSINLGLQFSSKSSSSRGTSKEIQVVSVTQKVHTVSLLYRLEKAKPTCMMQPEAGASTGRSCVVSFNQGTFTNAFGLAALAIPTSPWAIRATQGSTEGSDSEPISLVAEWFVLERGRTAVYKIDVGGSLSLTQTSKSDSTATKDSSSTAIAVQSSMEKILGGITSTAITSAQSTHKSSRSDGANGTINDQVTQTASQTHEEGDGVRGESAASKYLELAENKHHALSGGMGAVSSAFHSGMQKRLELQAGMQSSRSRSSKKSNQGDDIKFEMTGGQVGLLRPSIALQNAMSETSTSAKILGIPEWVQSLNTAPVVLEQKTRSLFDFVALQAPCSPDNSESMAEDLKQLHVDVLGHCTDVANRLACDTATLLVENSNVNLPATVDFDEKQPGRAADGGSESLLVPIEEKATETDVVEGSLGLPGAHVIPFRSFGELLLAAAITASRNGGRFCLALPGIEITAVHANKLEDLGLACCGGGKRCAATGSGEGEQKTLLGTVLNAEHAGADQWTAATQLAKEKQGLRMKMLLSAIAVEHETMLLPKQAVIVLSGSCVEPAEVGTTGIGDRSIVVFFHEADKHWLAVDRNSDRVLTLKEALDCLPAADLAEDAGAVLLLPATTGAGFEMKAYVGAVVAGRLVAGGHAETVASLFTEGGSPSEPLKHATRLLEGQVLTSVVSSGRSILNIGQSRTLPKPSQSPTTMLMQAAAFENYGLFLQGSSKLHRRPVGQRHRATHGHLEHLQKDPQPSLFKTNVAARVLLASLRGTGNYCQLHDVQFNPGRIDSLGSSLSIRHAQTGHWLQQEGRDRSQVCVSGGVSRVLARQAALQRADDGLVHRLEIWRRSTGHIERDTLHALGHGTCQQDAAAHVITASTAAAKMGNAGLTALKTLVDCTKAATVKADGASMRKIAFGSKDAGHSQDPNDLLAEMKTVATKFKRLLGLIPPEVQASPAPPVGIAAAVTSSTGATPTTTL